MKFKAASSSDPSAAQLARHFTTRPDGRQAGPTTPWTWELAEMFKLEVEKFPDRMSDRARDASRVRYYFARSGCRPSSNGLDRFLTCPTLRLICLD